jgi:hypothetical protein
MFDVCAIDDDSRACMSGGQCVVDDDAIITTIIICARHMNTHVYIQVYSITSYNNHMPTYVKVDKKLIVVLILFG